SELHTAAHMMRQSRSLVDECTCSSFPAVMRHHFVFGQGLQRRDLGVRTHPYSSSPTINRAPRGTTRWTRHRSSSQPTEDPCPSRSVTTVPCNIVVAQVVSSRE